MLINIVLSIYLSSLSKYDFFNAFSLKFTFHIYYLKNVKDHHTRILVQYSVKAVIWLPLLFLWYLVVEIFSHLNLPHMCIYICSNFYLFWWQLYLLNSIKSSLPTSYSPEQEYHNWKFGGRFIPIPLYFLFSPFV